MAAVIDRITAEARTIHPARVILTAVAAVLFGLGWITAKTCVVAWFVLAWCYAAVKVGWADARSRE